MSVNWDFVSLFPHSKNQWACDSPTDIHLLAALRSAASPGGRTLRWMRILTTCYSWRDVSTATTDSLLGFLGLHFPPRFPFPHPLPDKPASCLSPPQRSVFLRGSCPDGGTGDEERPPSLCRLGSRAYQGGACWSPLTWKCRNRRFMIKYWVRILE